MTLHDVNFEAVIASVTATLAEDVAEGLATTLAIFSQPGSYIVRLQAINDLESRRNPTYGFEFHCCWTNGYVRVDVVE